MQTYQPYWRSGRIGRGGSQLVADVALVRRVRDGRNDRCQYDVFRYPPIRWINLLETIDQFSEQRGNSPHLNIWLKFRQHQATDLNDVLGRVIDLDQTPPEYPPLQTLFPALSRLL